MSDPHRHAHVPSPAASALKPPLLPLFVVEKTGELRAAALYEHPMGLEIRIVDGKGEMVRTQVVRSTSEAEAAQVAATLEDGYKAKGWTPVAGEHATKAEPAS
jgi:hypothetical protein